MNIGNGWAGERRRVGEVEGVRAELEALVFAELEDSADGKIEVLLPRPTEAVAGVRPAQDASE